MADLLYGRNAVREALRARRRTFQRVLIAAGSQESGIIADIVKLADGAGVPVSRVDKRDLERRLREVNHQGVALECGDYPYIEVDEALAYAKASGEPPFFLLLDHLQDPQNVGTLLRTAEVVGVHAVMMPGRRSAEVTAAVVNASAGAVEHLRVASITNLAQTIELLQKQGIWVVGVEDDERAQLADKADLDMPLALVIGAEGPGLARLTRERCDYLIKLPMRGEIASLNAAVAGSILLYQAWRARGR